MEIKSEGLTVEDLDERIAGGRAQHRVYVA